MQQVGHASPSSRRQLWTTVSVAWGAEASLMLFLQQAEAAEVAAQLAAAQAVPKGRKPEGLDMPKAYHPKIVEAGWYDW